MKNTAQFKVVVLDRIVDPEQPMRNDLTPESVEDLAASIRQLGLIEPLVLKQKDDLYEVVAGHRRLLACQLAGLVEAPSYIVQVDDETADLMKIHENLQRKEISPIEEGKFFKYLTETYQWPAEKIAQLIGRSDAYVWARIAIDKYPADILEALESGQLTIGVARELAQIEDDDQRSQYIDYAIRNGITTMVAEQWKREYKSQKENPVPGSSPTIEAPQPGQAVVSMTKCGICNDDLPMRDAKLMYAHVDCVLGIHS